jgi:hypothetical protein
MRRVSKRTKIGFSSDVIEDENRQLRGRRSFAVM